MTSAALRSEFRDQGHRVGGAMVFDERTALALIARAEQEHIAIVDVDQVRPDTTSRYDTLGRSALKDMERYASWRQARLFVESLSDRGLYFQIALEPAYATLLAKLKYLFRTGVAWEPGSRAEDETLQ